MSDKNYELELYKTITDDENCIDELGWINDTQFCVWVNYFRLDDFMDRAKSIFGYGMFDDGGFDSNMQYNGVCIDLCEMLERYIDIEEVFPKDKYQH
jgi:hypothetical protein